MLAPPCLDQVGIEPTFRADELRIEQILGPWAKRALDPLADRQSETGLRSLEKLARDEPVQQLPQEIFAPAIADLQIF